MTIKEQIMADMKAAMKAHEMDRLGAIRLLMAAIKQKEVDERIQCTDADILAVVAKLVKQRHVLSAYLPKPLTDEEIAQIIDEAIAAIGATGMAAMGKVMGAVKPKLTGRADLGKVSALIKQKLMA